MDEGTLREGEVVGDRPVDFHCPAFLQDEENQQAQAQSQRLPQLDLVEFGA